MQPVGDAESDYAARLARQKRELARGPPRVRVLVPVALELLAVAALQVEIFQRWLRDPRYRYLVCEAALFSLFSLVYLFLRYEHRRLQMHGFLALYSRLKGLSRAIFFTSAYFTVASCVVFSFWGSDHAWERDFSRDDALDVVVSVQNLLLALALVIYALVAQRHNSDASAVPDVRLLEALPPSLTAQTDDPAPRAEMDLETLLKRQAQAISFLGSRVRALSEELLRAQSQGGAVGGAAAGGVAAGATAGARGGLEGRGFGSAPGAGAASQGTRAGADQAQVLEAKEQEIRALRAERDKTHKELRRALDETQELRRAQQVLQGDNKELMMQLESQKEAIARQAQEVSRLIVLLEVQKDANASSRRTIEQLERSVATAAQQQPIPIRQGSPQAGSAAAAGRVGQSPSRPSAQFGRSPSVATRNAHLLEED
jgi:hypothetical protein